jgi:hypothetical protein
MRPRKYISYQEFCKITRHENRYIHNEIVVSFLNGILEISKERQVTLSMNHRLWRAQLGNENRIGYDEEGNKYETDDPWPYPEKRMKPILNSAPEGRANPKGIPYLYLATDEKTAMSEVRPWKGSGISVGLFEVIQELNIIECADFSVFSNPTTPFIKTKGLTKDELYKIVVWRDIDNAFSVPVNTSDQTSDYIPTQIIAEFFKSEGFDGIAYKSSLSSGANIVLFNLKMADLIWCTHYEVTNINLDFKAGASYTKRDKVR